MFRWIGLAAILIVGGFLMVQFGFPKPDAAEVTKSDDDDPEGDPLFSQKPKFAEDRGGGELPKPVAFDGKRTMKYLTAVCAIGPRMSGTNGMRRQQELIRKHFEDLGAKVSDQVFEARQNSKPQPVEMTNLIVSYKPEAKRRVILCSHYDTRPIADQEPNMRHWREPFVSANDGGSGVAFLMEMGNHMKDLKTDVGVDFVFFDGEEYIFDRDGDRYFFGSEYFAKTWFAGKQRPTYVGAVLLDMIAGQNAKFPWEGHSRARYPRLCDEIWKLAKDLDCSVFQPQNGSRVQDDHVSLQKYGIPAIDIIDFDYPHWHRLSDTPDNCSPEPMEQVAKVLSVWMQRQK